MSKWMSDEEIEEMKMKEYIYAERVLSSNRYEDGLVESIVDPYGERREEIVRCQDCAHSCEDGTSCNYFCDFDDGLIIPAIVEPDGFCAWGRKRES